MLTGIVRWLKGYVTFAIIGKDAQRFISGAAARGYVLWNLRTEKETYCTACIAASRYRCLRFIAKKHRLRLTLLRRHGCPFLLRQWKLEGMQGLLFGALGAILLLCFFSTKVWVIDITGNETLSAEEIRSAASEFGLRVGGNKTDYLSERLENQLMLRFPEINWVAVNDWGGKVEIVLRESGPIPKVESLDEYGNVTAETGGQIVRMDVYHGRKRVRIGDGVVPGQLLVSGVLEDNNGRTHFTKAQAKIMANTKRTFRVKIPTEKTVRKKTGEEIVRRSVSVFGVILPLNLFGTPEGEPYQKETRKTPMVINGVELPVALLQEIYSKQEETTAEVSEEEAKEKGISAIRKLQKKTLQDPLEDGKILSESIRISREKNVYVIESRCRCLENIAKEVPFYLEFEQNDKKFSGESEKD